MTEIEYSVKPSCPQYHLFWENDKERWTPTHEDLMCEVQLGALGDWVPLDFKIDETEYQNNIKLFEEKDWFRPFQPKKNILNDRKSVLLYGLPNDEPTAETGLSHIHARLGYKPEENEFNFKTAAGDACTSMDEVFNFFEMGRTFFIRLNAGGHYPKHRDHVHLTRSTFRLIAFLGSNNLDKLHWEVDGKSYQALPNHVYYVDTRKMHRLSASGPNCDMVVMNIKKDWYNVQKILSRLKHR